MKLWLQLCLFSLLVEGWVVFPQTNQEIPNKGLFNLNIDESKTVHFSILGQKPKFNKESDFNIICNFLLNNDTDNFVDYFVQLSPNESRIPMNSFDVLQMTGSFKISDFAFSKPFDYLTHYRYDFNSWSCSHPSYKENIKTALLSNLSLTTIRHNRFRFVRSSFMDELKGLQYSLINFADDIEGGQAGALNVSNLISGFQLGIVNIGGNVDGFQVGLVNISDSIKGCPIGLINYSKTGTQKLLFWTDNLNRFNLGIKFNVNNTYSIIYVGQNNIYKDMENSLSYGARYGYRFINFSNFSLGADAGYLRMDSEKYSIDHMKSDENALALTMISDIGILDLFSFSIGYGINYIWSDSNGISSGVIYGHFLVGIELFL